MLRARMTKAACGEQTTFKNQLIGLARFIEMCGVTLVGKNAKKWFYSFLFLN